MGTMAWIHQDTIDAINNNVRISDVFTWLGERVTSNNRMAWCPFCHDKSSRHPGCSIDNENGLYHCFVCHRGGNIFSFVREHEGCSFPESVEMIAKQFKIDVKYDESKGNVRDESRKNHLSSVLERANEIFIAQRGQREFKEFVSRRHLTEDAVSKFEIGFSAARFANAAISRLRERFSDDDIVASGIAYRREDGQVVLHMQDRVTIPTRSIAGRLVAFGGRDVTGRSPAKYKNSPETELFRKGSVLYGMNLARREISRRKYAILCEGYMDTIALHQHGFPNAIGAMGTAVTMWNLELLARTADVLYVSLDADAAGIAAASRIARNIPEGMRMDVRAVEMPLSVAKDPDEWFNQAGKTEDDYKELLGKATPIFLFCANHMIDDEVRRIDEATERGDDGEVRNARLQAESKVSDLMVQSWEKIDIDQRRAIAESFARRTKTAMTYDDILEQWRAEAAGKSSYRPVRQQGDMQGQGLDLMRPTFTNAETRNEDMIIGALYYGTNETRAVIKGRQDEVNGTLTSSVRQSIFQKLNRVIAEGKPPKAVQEGLSDTEMAELSRIITSPVVRDNRERLGTATIEQVCDDLAHKALVAQIDQMSNSDDLDFEALFDLQTALNELEERIQARKK